MTLTFHQRQIPSRQSVPETPWIVCAESFPSLLSQKQSVSCFRCHQELGLKQKATSQSPWFWTRTRVHGTRKFVRVFFCASKHPQRDQHQSITTKRTGICAGIHLSVKTSSLWILLVDPPGIWKHQTYKSTHGKLYDAVFCLVCIVWWRKKMFVGCGWK